MTEEVHGILFGNHLALRYFNLADRKIHSLNEEVGPVYAICVSQDDVYYGAVKKGENLIPRVKSLFGGFESPERAYEVTAMVEHNGRLLDAERTWSWFGEGSGLRDTLENKVMISGEKLGKNGISYIMSLRTGPDGNLFGLVKYGDNKHGLIEITVDEKQHPISRAFRVHEKFNGNLFLCDAVIVPFPDIKWSDSPYNRLDRDGKLIVIGSANDSYRHLDINGKLIHGTETKDEHVGNLSIRRIELLGQEGDQVDVIYSAGGFGSALDNRNSLLKARIDLRQGELTEKEVLVKNIDRCVTALEPVRDHQLHQKLIGPIEDN